MLILDLVSLGPDFVVNVLLSIVDVGGGRGSHERPTLVMME